MMVSTGPGATVSDVLARAQERLAAAGVEAPRRDARLLLAAATGLDMATIIARPELELNATDKLAEFETMLRRRAAREPVSRILEMREFWSMKFEVTNDTLDPRADSETLIQALLDSLGERRNAALRVLDLGCGTGCLLLALLSELPAASGLGVDLCDSATAVATRNASRLGLADRAVFAQGDWASDLVERFDLVVCNPPYVPSSAIAALEPEVRDHDPALALDGGVDGLDAYRRIAPDLSGLLRPGGRVGLEVGIGQSGSVVALLRAAGFVRVMALKDLSGIERCVLGYGTDLV